jgi:hypothetical protein
VLLFLTEGGAFFGRIKKINTISADLFQFLKNQLRLLVDSKRDYKAAHLIF